MDEILYVDSCVWLNLLWQEVGKGPGKPLWHKARDFLLKAVSTPGYRIALSSLVLKELEHKLSPSQFVEAKKMMVSDSGFTVIKPAAEDYALARCLEKDNLDQLSFYDYLHVSLCLNHNMTLVTRDRALLEFSKGRIKAYLPENLIS